ncbi:MAG: tetratricopeptide repeat protein [Blastocatellia bacterium]|nr:tetratricopeptide repeat protein [Blastocatellia bacterium]
MEDKERKQLKFLRKKKVLLITSLLFSLLLCINYSSKYFRQSTKATGNEKQQNRQPIKVKDSLIQRAESETDAIQLAYMFEQASRQIEADPRDPVPFLVRAVVGEKLFLIDQANHDYKSYGLLSGQSRYPKAKHPVSEPDAYEKLELAIDGYLLAHSSNQSSNKKEATSYLHQATNFAEEIAHNNDRFGVDLVSFYSTIPDTVAKELLGLRQRKNLIAATAAIENFEKTIEELRELEELFQQQSATIELESIAYLLAKFLMKSDNQRQEASKIIETYLPITKASSHRLNEAKLIFLRGEIAVYDGDETVSINFHNESLEKLQTLLPTNFVLYPLYSIVGRQANTGSPETALLQGLPALSLSLGLMKKSEKLYSGLASLFAQFQGLAADNLRLEHLSEAYLHLAIKIAEESRLGYVLEAQCLLATLEAVRGKRDTALEAMAKAYEFADPDPTVDTHILSAYKGKVFGLLGDYEVSETEYRKAFEIIQKKGIDNLPAAIQTEQGLGEALWMQGKKREAKKHLEAVKKRLLKAGKDLKVLEKPNRLIGLNFTSKTPDQLLASEATNR